MSAEFWSWDRYDSEARRLYDEGDYDAARELLEEGLSLHPASAELRVSLAYAELAREEYAWARGWFEEALGLEPDHEEALLGMGEVLLKFGERGRAFMAFDRILELGFGEDADLMLSVGRALYREELYERAERFFRLALASDEDCSDAASELAFTLYRLGDVDEALSWVRRALTVDPELHEARAFHANLLYDRGEFEAALEELCRIPPAELWDPVAAWRTVDLLRRLRDLPPEAPELAPWVARLEELGTEPTPEEQLLAEIEAIHAGETPARRDRDQLDLFGWLPRREAGAVHVVRTADGTRYEGDWLSIVRGLRDDSAHEGLSLAEYMREEARRLHNLTGVRIPHDDPQAFLREAARLGVFEIER